jgi:predicted ATP-grasp superfamily ATP-dependent carboligase
VDVLLTQAWGRSAYNVVRSLGRRGLSVVVGTDRFSSMAAYSRYAAGTFQHALAIAQTTEFISDVRHALQQYAPNVYMPTAEDTFIIAKFSDHLPRERTVIPIASFETIRTLHKKDALARLAASLSIPTPRTSAPRTADDIRAFLREVGAPIVLKRVSSSGARGVSYVSREGEIEPWFTRHVPVDQKFLRGFIAQQFVEGDGCGVSVLYNHGQLRATFTHKRLREKTSTGGISTLRVGTVMPEIEAYAHRLLEHVKFHGVAMVEFKHNERTGESWLLEVNPRFWGSLALAVQSGVDFPYLLYQMATKGDVEPVTRYRPGRVVRWLLGDARALLSRAAGVGQRRAGPALQMAAGYDDLYADDPLPFVASPVLSLRKALGTGSWKADEIDLNIDLLDRIPVR